MTWAAGTFSGGVQPLSVASGIRSTPDGSSFSSPSTQNPYVVKASDLGMYLQAYSICTDGAGTELASTSGLSQNVARPVLDEYDLFIDSVWTDPTAQHGMTPSSTAVFEIKPKGDVVFNPKDVTFEWKIRTGTGRFSGDTNKPAVIYFSHDSAPSAALIECKYVSQDANDNAVVSFEILVST